MIREVKREDIPSCVNLIRTSFMTVADEYGFTEENAPRFTAFAISADRLIDCIGIWIKSTDLCLLLQYDDTQITAKLPSQEPSDVLATALKDTK